MKLGKQNHTPLSHHPWNPYCEGVLVSGAPLWKNMAAQGSLGRKLAASKISRIPTWNPQLQKKQKKNIVHPENLVNFTTIWKIFSLIFLMALILSWWFQAL